MIEQHKYFGESAEYVEGEEKEAKQYLESWKKFLLRRLIKDSYNVVIKNEQWGERDGQSLAKTKFMYLKLYIEADWHYELGKPIK